MISASDRQNAVELIDEAVEHGASLKNACKILKISPKTYERWVELQKNTGSYGDLRPIAKRNRQTFIDWDAILEVLNSKEFVGVPPCEIVPILADRGVYIASESSFYRVKRDEKRKNYADGTENSEKKPKETHEATTPNQVWMWDITYLRSHVVGIFYYLYMVMDLYSRKIIHWEIYSEQSAENASEFIRKAKIKEGLLSTSPLVLHSDNGGPMKGRVMLETLYKLGITPSNSRPRVSNDNAYAESLFHTMKGRPNYQPEGFETIQQAQEWVLWFVGWYNGVHRHSGIKYLTPNQRHSGAGEGILEARTAVYEAAKSKYPERWRGRETRDWGIERVVYLNPMKERGVRNTA